MNHLLTLSGFSLALLLTNVANASTLQQQLASCATIANGQQRLVCFDKINHQPQDTLEIDKTELFGFEAKQTLLTPDKLQITVVNIDKGPRGKLTFTLANGQIWKQTSSESYRLKDNKQAFIKKGALGSFFLGQVDRNKKIRIKRVK